MSDSPVWFYMVPIIVFGPLFGYVFYNFGLREMMKIPGEMKEKRAREAIEKEAFEKERGRKRGTGPVGIVRRANATPLGFALQAVTYGLFAAFLGYFASAPAYEYRPAGTALIKLSISHAGKRQVECRKRSREELAELPPNMRAAKSCSRERWPVYVEVILNGDVIFSGAENPAGLSDDGYSTFYSTLTVPTGGHDLITRIKDDNDATFDFEHSEKVDLAESQNLVIRFDRATNGILYQ